MLEWIVHRVHNISAEAKYFDTELVYYYDVDDLKDGYHTVAMPKKAKPIPTQSTQTGMGKKKQKARVQITHQVIPFKKKDSTQIGSQLGGNYPSELVRGDNIFFTYEKSTIQGTHIKVEGYRITSDKKKEPVMGYLPVDKYSAAELETILEVTSVFVGNYIGYSKLRSGKYQIFCAEVRPETEYNTILGETVTESELKEAGNCCHDCGSIITKDDDDAFWVRRNNSNDITRILCSTCVATHPHLGLLLQTGDFETCQNESFSLDTNSVQLH